MENISDREDSIDQKKEIIKQDIDHRIADIKVQSKKLSTTLLIVGGAALLTFVLIRSVIKKPKAKDKADEEVEIDGQKYKLVLANNNKESMLIKMIREYMMLFLVSLAKKKLNEYLSKLKNN